MWNAILFPSVLRYCCLGITKASRTCKKLGVGLLAVMISLALARLTAAVVTNTCVILNSSKFQNWSVWYRLSFIVLANGH